jgi:hypothetical protein
MTHGFHVGQWPGLAAAIGVTLAFVGPATAQRPDSRMTLDSGRLVRFHTQSNTTQGRLLSPLLRTDASARFCRYPGAPCTDVNDTAAMRSLPVTQVLHLDVQAGTGAAHGAVVGGVIGGVSGLLLGGFAGGMGESGQSSTGPAIKGALLVGAFGAGLGALFGSTSVRWSVGPW